MSGPIVRKYGFPNFEQIFGKRELEHGVDEPEEAPGETPAESPKVEEKEAKPAEPPTEKK